MWYVNNDRFPRAFTFAWPKKVGYSFFALSRLETFDTLSVERKFLRDKTTLLPIELSIYALIILIVSLGFSLGRYITMHSSWFDLFCSATSFRDFHFTWFLSCAYLFCNVETLCSIHTGYVLTLTSGPNRPLPFI